MSYLALARKWRPRSFSDVAGQDHIVRALLNALQTDRLHHAYLFAGTRGVGKTTLGRLFAKALNCEAGVNGEPCGECSNCLSIDEGRFVDLIEIDGASNRGINEARELLQNVAYTPTTGRYKVYLIDEVHMFTKEAFNALLKTLEEPPPHVKFLLATTDPQKLPVTVLSRCLQFNLKRLPAALIDGRMAYICEQEGIKAEPAALQRIARAANGSMRDGLSLLDQALVFGGGKLLEKDVADMLGSLDPRHLKEILQALGAGDAPALMQQARELQTQVPDYAGVLEDLAVLLQQVAVVQLAGIDALDEDADVELAEFLAGQLDAETVQLYYQIAVTGCRDIELAPDPRIGFEMTLLRMLSFRPSGTVSGAEPGGKAGETSQAESSASPKKTSAAKSVAPAATQPAVTSDWDAVLGQLALRGMARQLALSCVIGAQDSNSLQLEVSSAAEYLMTEAVQAVLKEALQQHFGEQLRVSFMLAGAEVGSPKDIKRAADEQQQTIAEDALQTSPVIEKLIRTFDAQVADGSVKPVDRQTRH